MNRYVKISAALAAFALLLVVMGLSTQSAVEAQEAIVQITGTGTDADTNPSRGISYVCSDAAVPRDGCDAADATFEIAVTGAIGGGTEVTLNDPTAGNDYAPSRIVTFHNLDLARDTASSTRPEDRNPKSVYLSGENTTFQVLVVRKSTGLMDSTVTRGADPNNADNMIATIMQVASTDADPDIEVKGFHGNRIRVSYSSGTGSIGTDEIVTVDDVKPTLVTNAPSTPLIVKGNVDITFSADMTDSLAGYTTINTSTMGINRLTGTDGTLGNVGSADTPKGGVRLVVAGNVVELDRTNFTKIDGGWNVWATIGSTALQNISTNVPWYFETRDRAGNTRRTSGTISGTASGGSATTITDTKFDGNLGSSTFQDSSIRITRLDENDNPVVSNSQPIEVLEGGAGFSGLIGTFTFPNNLTFPDEDPLFGDAPENIATTIDPVDDVAVPKAQFDVDDYLYVCPLAGDDANVSLAAARAAAVAEMALVDNVNANAIRTMVTNEVVASNILQLADCAAYVAKEKTTYEILGSNLVTVDSESPMLEDSRATVITGKAYNPVTKGDKTGKNSIKLVFTDTGKEDDEAPGSGLDASSVTPSAFSVSGNSVESVSVQAGNKVYLTLSDNLGSTERPAVTVVGGSIKDKAGNGVDGTTIDKAHDGLGPNLELAKSGDLSNEKVTVTIATDEQLNAVPTVWVTDAKDKDGTAKILTNGKAPKSSAEGTPATGAVRQTGALTYSYEMKADGANEGEYSVFVLAKDTNGNASTSGDAASSATAKAFTFELDNRLNSGEEPKVTVADEDTDTGSESVLEAEAVDPMIVTVDFSNEGLARGMEYQRDGYRTVELTSAKLKITFADGTTESKTFNLTTEISTPDSIKFTIPLLNPKLGTYELTVQAVDQAGNVRTDSAGTTPQGLKATWKVIKPSPVDIKLAPGWNLVSLPFQPANPAINSVINVTHPAKVVMTFDNVSQVWMVSRRDGETGLFVGDIAVMTASTAYFILTENFQSIRMLRPPLATAAAAPPPPPAITVVEGWNLVPIVSNEVPTPKAIAADEYFGTLRSGAEAGWLKALTFDTLVRTWISVTPGDSVTMGPDGTNPCTGSQVVKANVEAGTEPCQIGQYDEKSTSNGDVREDEVAAVDVENTPIDETKPQDGNNDGYVGDFDENDTVTIGRPVTVGKGYWLYSTVDGVIIP